MCQPFSVCGKIFANKGAKTIQKVVWEKIVWERIYAQ